MSTPEVERVLGMVRQRGGRVTAARRAVVEVLFDGHGEHLTADSVAARVQATHPDVHLSTVYRTLDALEALGVATHVHLGHGPSTYHLSDEDHHHVVCSVCGRMAEVPDEVLAEVADAVERATGMRLTPHFALEGRCEACRQAPAGGNASTPPR